MSRGGSRTRILEAIQNSDTMDEAHAAYGDVKWSTFLQAVSRVGLREEFRAKFGEEFDQRQARHRAESGAATAERNRIRGAAAEAALIEDAEFLLKHGETKANAPRRLGYNSWDSLYVALERANRLDIAARFAANDEFVPGSGLGGAVRGGKFVMPTNAGRARGWRFPS